MKVKTPKSRIAAGTLAAAALALSAADGRCATPSYPGVVQGDGALGYYRFNDSLARTDKNVNIGSLGAAGNATNDLEFVTGGTVYSMPGAIAGDSDRAAFYDFTTRTEIPFNAAINTANTQPFTLEVWLYPVSDQANNGMGALCNRYAQGADPSIGLLGRQGWVIYQRGASTNTSGFTQGPGVGWQFNTYDGADTSQRLKVTSGVPFTLGKWQHVVVVYDPVDSTATNATTSMYIDGVLATVTTNNATDGSGNPIPGYAPCTGNHDPTIAVNGQPAMALGGYNNANGGTYGFENPWTGGIDEFAWYGTKLSAAQILAHYQNGTNANRSTPYSTLIKSDNPVVYLRLNEVAPGRDTSFNIGDARSAGHATNTPALKHPGVSALAGEPGDGSIASHLRGAGASGHAYADIPFNAGNNPDAGVPFTIELWARPTSDNVNNGPALLNNRLAGSATDRTGWVLYQRDPNATYSGTPAGGGEGIGWDFRMYNANLHNSGGDVKTQLPYNIGEWQHLVITWEPQSDLGPSAAGSEVWNGIQIFYVNGVSVATNASANYAANIGDLSAGSDAGLNPADFAVGSYNLSSGLGEEFEGDLDEVAFYNNVVLTPDQILAHYMTGTNAHPAVNYATLVMTAGGDTYLANNPGFRIPERTTVPQTYLRFNEPAYFPAANSGSLGSPADGAIIVTTNNGTGPAGTGFGSPNPSVPFDGATGWVALNNLGGASVSGQITLEAWINPAASQGTLARVISHGPATPATDDINVYPTVTFTGWQVNSNEVFLRIEGGGAAYSVGTSDGTTFHGATAAVTAGDLGGGNGWIHLVGTFDGTHWNLYRNGVQIASVSDSQGPLAINGPEWAVGATGMGWGDFYAGGIDEVAIYGTALSPATVKAHYYVGQNGPVSLTITESGGVVTVHWPAGTLQQSSTAGSGYTDVPGATAPAYSPSPLSSAKYYRVKL